MQHVKTWPKCNCTQTRQAKNKRNKHRDFPIFPVFVILTALSAHISENYVREMYFIKCILIQQASQLTAVEPQTGRGGVRKSS